MSSPGFRLTPLHLKSMPGIAAYPVNPVNPVNNHGDVRQRQAD